MNEALMPLVGIAGIWMLLVFLRVPVLASFFSLLIGHVLAVEAGGEAYNFVGGVLNLTDFSYVQIALLFLPLALTVLFLRGRLASSKVVLELVPNLLVAVTGVLLLVPLAPNLAAMVDSATNSNFQSYKTVILVAAAISGLLSAWTSFPKPAHSGKRHK